MKFHAVSEFGSRIYAAAIEIVHKPEFTVEAVKGTPPAIIAAWTMNDVVVGLTAAYIVVQIAYLVRKWYREEKGK